MNAGYLYEPLPDVAAGRRLHLNENTDGCSPAVLRAVQDLTRQQVAWYPAYAEATAGVARHLGVSTDSVLLTNGLDEGILTLALALLPRGTPAGEAVVVEPSYGMYGPAVELAGGVIRSAAAAPDLSMAMDNVVAAITSATRIVMLSNPNNPAGHLLSGDVLAGLADVAGPDVCVFVDEAYADFAGCSVVPLIATRPNLVVGRTFAKAYGLAGVRIGCLVAAPDVIRRLRGAIAPFSVNVFAVAALSAALGEQDHLAWYLSQVQASKDLLYAAFERLGLHYWRSAANFVLVRVGDAPAVRHELAARGIHVRDRSTAAGCEGCIRITAGLPDDARACVSALEEVLCDAQP